jgi:hypothetical protein
MLLEDLEINPLDLGEYPPYPHTHPGQPPSPSSEEKGEERGKGKYKISHKKIKNLNFKTDCKKFKDRI